MLIVGYFGAGLAIFLWATLVADCAHFALAASGYCKKGHPQRLFMQLGVGGAAAVLMLLIAPLLPVFLGLAAVVARFLYDAARPVAIPRGPIPAPRRALVPDAAYHALHAEFPDRFFGSATTLFDMLFGTGCSVKGRVVALTGASGAFGAPLTELLLDAGVAEVIPLKFGVNYTYDDYSACDGALQRAEILVLAHGAKGDLAMRANCESFVAFIERFRTLSVKRRIPPEVWAVGSEIEAHPAWGNPELQVYLESKRAFARRARAYFWDPDFIYRHIVPSAFRSAMGPGFISGTTAARWAWFFIRRGFRYVPVSYTGIALINYFKFLFRIGSVEQPLNEGTRRRIGASTSDRD